MADDRNELRQVNWSELFSFTQVFKSFKMAIHPSKLLLAVAVIVLTWLAGQGMDLVWCWSNADIKPDEPKLYADPNANFSLELSQWKEKRPGDAGDLLYGIRQRGASDFNQSILKNIENSSPFRDHFAKAMDELKSGLPVNGNVTDSGDYAKQAQKSLGPVLKNIREDQGKQADVLLQAIEKTRANVEKYIDAGKDPDQKDMIPEGKDKAWALRQLKANYVIARQNLTDWKEENIEKVKKICGVGVFDAFTTYESKCITSAISAVGNGNFLGDWDAAVRKLTNTQPPKDAPAASAIQGPGFFYHFIMAIVGLKWLLGQHWLFGVLFLAIVLAVWALLGGAIYRIAALHAAREEKISLSQALKFAVSKWASFFTAPLIPLCVILVLGLFIALGSLLVNVPYIGAPVVGILFFLALALGLAIAFVAVGLLGGSGLMYPTIAVEGSDSFDAISRSFAYVYARPWRAGLYSAVALVYGVACYVFVRFFVFLALAGTHRFMGWGVFTGGESLGANDRVPVIWTPPTWDSLYGNFRWEAMSGSEHFAAVFIWIWVALLAAVVGGFLLTFIASSSTVVYYLLRRKVDATDLDDVYVQESSELPTDAPAGDASATSAPAPDTAAPPADQATPPPANP